MINRALYIISREEVSSYFGETRTEKYTVGFLENEEDAMKYCSDRNGRTNSRWPSYHSYDEIYPLKV